MEMQERKEKKKRLYNMTDEWLQCALFYSDTHSTRERIEYVGMKYAILQAPQKKSKDVCGLSYKSTH